MADVLCEVSVAGLPQWQLDALCLDEEHGAEDVPNEPMDTMLKDTKRWNRRATAAGLPDAVAAARAGSLACGEVEAGAAFPPELPAQCRGLLQSHLDELCVCEDNNAANADASPVGSALLLRKRSRLSASCAVAAAMSSKAEALVVEASSRSNDGTGLSQSVLDRLGTPVRDGDPETDILTEHSDDSETDSKALLIRRARAFRRRSKGISSPREAKVCPMSPEPADMRKGGSPLMGSTPLMGTSPLMGSSPPGAPKEVPGGGAPLRQVQRRSRGGA